LKRFAVLFLASVTVLVLTYCGGGGSSTTPPSKVSHRSFLSNTYTGNLQIMDTQNDTTPYTAETTNSAGQVVPGVPVTITAGISSTFLTVSADLSKTMVYDPSQVALYFIANSTETASAAISLPAPAQMALFSSDGTLAYAAVHNAPITGGRPGGVSVVDITNSDVKVTYGIPNATYIALSPSGQYLLVFADTSDSVFLLNLTASTVATVEIPGFARPVNAFFSTDSNTAYVISCGPECGSTAGPPSVSQLDIPSQTIKATVAVGGASVGLMKGTTLYVAGTPGTAGTYDAVNIGTMTRTTTNSVAIGDGTHASMALATNNKLYIGASTCANQTTGCLSVVDVSNNTADAPLPPKGNVTGMLAIAGRNTVYVIEGGYLVIYDTSTDKPQQKQVVFTGALYGIAQVDQ